MPLDFPSYFAVSVQDYIQAALSWILTYCLKVACRLYHIYFINS
jgi:hypothetical protein